MKRLRGAYFIAANTAILWLLVEASAHLAIRTYEWVRPSIGDSELSRDSSRLRLRYAPIVGFVEDSFTSRFINVDARGIRANGTGSGPIDGAIWFLGGDSTFGVGVADHETIPARLESALKRPVINFGARGHYSAVENRLLNHYLRLGFTPAAVIFLDGINEACEPDLSEDELGQLVSRSQQGYRWDIARPVVYAATRLGARLERAFGAADDSPYVFEPRCRAAGQDQTLAAVQARLLAERAALCELYTIRCTTFIQPFAGSSEATYLRDLYAHLEETWRSAGATFLTDAAHQSIANAIAVRLRTP